jgi:hypothetical protein
MLKRRLIHPAGYKELMILKESFLMAAALISTILSVLKHNFQSLSSQTADIMTPTSQQFNSQPRLFHKNRKNSLTHAGTLKIICTCAMLLF